MAKIPILCAPTASGKTAMALRLAEDFDIEIVAADAFTIYRGMDIGTAKPTPAEQQAVKHHLIDVIDVKEQFDVNQYTTQAQAAIADILSRKKIPLVVGGTGFYISALIQGIPLAPRVQEDQRHAIEQELQERGLDALLDEIAQINTDQHTRMERNPRRVVRALEVYRSTGRFPSEYGFSQPQFQYEVFAFSPSLEELEYNIQQRTRLMLPAWQTEALWLATQVNPYLVPRPTAWQALGYELVWQQGETAYEQVVTQTRQYAKRQLTWFKRQLNATLLSPQEAETALRDYLSAWVSV